MAKIGRPREFKLSTRQLQVIRLLADPRLYSLKHIADEMGIGEQTLRCTYLRRIYFKLGMKSGSVRLLAIWAMFHAEELGLEPLREEYFHR